MHPLLLEIGGFTIHTYGFLVALGFLAGVYTMRRLARFYRLSEERIVDLAFWSLILGFVGSRLLYVITQWDYFAENPSHIIRIWEGGLVFYGSPMVLVPFLMWYIPKNRLPFWTTMDIAVTGVVIGHAFGRLGCFSAGCCYGKPTDSWVGVRFQSPLVESSIQGTALHPVQLYETGALLVLFAGLLWLHRRKEFPGYVTFAYFIIYAAIRFAVEFFRGDDLRGFVFGGTLSTSQFVAIWVVILSVVAFVVKQRRHANAR